MGLSARTTFDPMLGGGGVGFGGGASNNPSYSGGGFSSNSKNMASSNSSTVGTVAGVGGTIMGEIISAGSEFVARYVPPLQGLNIGANIVKDTYDYYTQDEKDKMSDAEKSVVEKAEALQKAQEEQAKGHESLENELKNIVDGIRYNEGDVLPDVFSRNAKALSTSINSLTSVLSEQLGLLNNNMMAMLIYQDQFLDIETKKLSALSNIKGSSTAPITLDTSALASQFASVSPAIQSLSNSITGISPNTSLEKINKTISTLKLETAPITLDTNALAIQFAKVSPSIDSISKAIEASKLNIDPLNKSIIGVNGALDKLVELKKVDNEQVKEHYDIRSEEIELNVDSLKFAKDPVSSSLLETDNVAGMPPREIAVVKHSNDIEAKVYARTSQEIKDLDGETVLEASPREARLAKDATVAKDHTDKINFSLDDDGDLDDIIEGIDLPSIFGYSGDTEPIKEFYTRLGGQGL